MTPRASGGRQPPVCYRRSCTWNERVRLRLGQGAHAPRSPGSTHSASPARCRPRAAVQDGIGSVPAPAFVKVPDRFSSPSSTPRERPNHETQQSQRSAKCRAGDRREPATATLADAADVAGARGQATAVHRRQQPHRHAQDGPDRPAPGDRAGQYGRGGQHNRFRQHRVRHAADHHPDGRPARAEHRERIGDDHGPGGGRDGQRRRERAGYSRSTRMSPRRSRA